MNKPTYEIATTNPRARKDHQCFGCGGAIRKGTHYINYRGVFDGDFCAVKFHTPCWGLANEHDIAVAAKVNCEKGLVAVFGKDKVHGADDGEQS